MIEVKNVTKSYNKVEALKNLTLNIKDTSIFGLVGINGSGKSTLLRLLSGVYQQDEGEILFDNQSIYQNEKKKKEIFFLPDDPFYGLNMTGKDLAELYRVFYDFDDKMFKKYLEIYQLDPKLCLRNFSKGMKRRLFVSLAFASNAKYLLLDEVFDGLDPSARLIFKKGLIETLADKGGTAVIASHSLRELEDICDSFGLINNKNMLHSGDINEALQSTFKFLIALKNPITRQELGFECLAFESSGRIIRITVSGDKQEYINKINNLKPLAVDEIPVDFEEFFIASQDEFLVQQWGKRV